ncbi:IPT/TIG domain-containing protein [Myxococcus sp. CA040A]|uniref:IPT/TIG domain-containing protein n=1 Tax=Myxococcus sp. CA040A TaxID=2741738 RepID=UPI00157AC847|nr:IPT/TIG domain-containing protein [Myxococcus sp. CA040A]NTX02829.1 IPT/TIG domain-containing protein [Myxococcus sp. CA040A]
MRSSSWPGRRMAVPTANNHLPSGSRESRTPIPDGFAMRAPARAGNCSFIVHDTLVRMGLWLAARSGHFWPGCTNRVDVERPLRGFVLGLLVLVLAACGGSSRPPGDLPDAGSRDAGAEDAGPTDAGTQVDAGASAAPVIHSALPTRGESGGGTWVTLKGRGFVEGVAATPSEAALRTEVRVGSRAVRDFQLIDDTTLDLRTPPGIEGTADVSVTNPNGTTVCAACFTYFDVFDFRAVSPDTGAQGGGNTVTLVGAGFPSSTGLQVLFGGTASPSVKRVSSSALRAVVPRSNTVGPVDVRVQGAGVGDVLRRAYRYVEDTRVTDIAPLTGTTFGGTSVVFTGQGFEGTTEVFFGNTPAPSFRVESPTRLVVTSPPHMDMEAVPVRIVTPRGAWTVRQGFTYADSPQGTVFGVLGIFPRVGTREDGTVTLTGLAFDFPDISVTFDETPVQIVAATRFTLTVRVPPRGTLSRTVPVTVSAASLRSHLPGGYTYRLALTRVTPGTGPSGGGSQVLLEGDALPPDAMVRVGALLSPDVTVLGTTELRLITPPGGAGAHALHVSSASDPENEALLQNAFTYEPALVLSQVEPARGAIAGGSRVTVRGTGFVEGIRITFGGEPASDVHVVDAHILTCRTPVSRSQGPVEVAVIQGAVRSALSEAFTYFDPRGPGGLSGALLTGTLNVTVLDTSSGTYGQPVVGAKVLLGTGSTALLQGETDARGQLTLSDSRMVGAQSVTVFKAGHDVVTVAGIRSENLTVYLRRLDSEGNPGNPPVPASARITGRVRGFKPPRPLQPGEVLEARVFVAQLSPASGPPFAGPGDRRAETWRIREEGGAYVVQAQPGLRAVYAVLGVLKDEVDFVPYLLGVRRGIAASGTRVSEGQDVVFDVHLDVAAPLSLAGPVIIAGEEALHQVYAWLDLGAEGLVPHPHNWGTGSRFFSSVEGPGPLLTFPQLPRVDGASLLFLDLLRGTTAYPQSVLYHRQPGALEAGVTLPPILPLPVFTEPARDARFTGAVAWTPSSSGATPDVQVLTLMAPGTTGGIRWTAVLPGGETRVTLPETALQALRAELPEGARLRADLSLARVPRFEYSQWTYDTLSTATWTAYVLGRSEVFDP